MRISRALLGDYYAIHKLYSEFLLDTGQKTENSTDFWLDKFSKTDFFLFMAHHGKDRKRFVGMIWGELAQSNKKLELQGVFVRRGFRTKFSAIRKLTEEVSKFAKQQGALELCAIVPENQLKSVKRKGFKVTGLVVERTL